jgi:hypothetical protein
MAKFKDKVYQTIVDTGLYLYFTIPIPKWQKKC